MRNHTPGYRLKKLYKDRMDQSLSLKDFAVELASNGTRDQKDLVEAWFKNKS